MKGEIYWEESRGYGPEFCISTDLWLNPSFSLTSYVILMYT